MNKEIIYFEGVRSKTLQNALYSLDDHIGDMEYTIEKQQEKIKELQNKLFKEYNKSIENGNKMMANTLLAAIGIPEDISTIGSVGATVMMNIYDMKDMKEVRSYIDKIRKKFL